MHIGLLPPLPAYWVHYKVFRKLKPQYGIDSVTKEQGMHARIVMCAINKYIFADMIKRKCTSTNPALLIFN